MQLSSYCLSLSLALLVLAQQAPKELDIKTTFEPSHCITKARKGDAIKVHYVRWLPDALLNVFYVA
jgi:hypothetical protein